MIFRVKRQWGWKWQFPNFIAVQKQNVKPEGTWQSESFRQRWKSCSLHNTLCLFVCMFSRFESRNATQHLFTAKLKLNIRSMGAWLTQIINISMIFLLIWPSSRAQLERCTILIFHPKCHQLTLHSPGFFVQKLSYGTTKSWFYLTLHTKCTGCGITSPGAEFPIGWCSATEEQANHIHQWQPVALPPSTLWMKIFLIEGEEQHEWTGMEEKKRGNWGRMRMVGEGGRREGWSKEAMSHISDLDPCGLLFTLVTPSSVCVCVCMYHVCVVVCESGQSAESQSDTLDS